MLENFWNMQSRYRHIETEKVYVQVLQNCAKAKYGLQAMHQYRLAILLRTCSGSRSKVEEEQDEKSEHEMPGHGPSKKRKHASSNSYDFSTRWNAADGFL
jgi:hypothetical protein